MTSQPYKLSNFLTSAINIIGSNAELIWIKQKIMHEAKVQFWSELPIIVPPTKNFSHLLNISTTKAMNAGLSIRELSQTLLPLLQWDRKRRDIPLKCGLPPEKEALLLELASK